jgi:opacity protein-like surface antigen
MDFSVIQKQLDLMSTYNGIPALDFGKRHHSYGWQVALNQNMTPWFGVVADFSGGYLTKSLDVTSLMGPVPANLKIEARDRISLYTFMAGPQFTLRRSDRVQPFGRVLFGGMHLKDSFNMVENGLAVDPDTVTKETGFALGFGGGADIRVNRIVAVRLTADVIRTHYFNEPQYQPRFSAGLAFNLHTLNPKKW